MKKNNAEFYLGKQVHVIIQEENHLLDAWGKVTQVDSSGRLHGTWGDQVATLGIDYVGLGD